ncbi:deoxyribose-phosphate aldolase [Tetragenococcus halophilus subsp. flandriensis]|uniref:deoxyribose-phosphate aldolase n=1 Tax=Tetragenococcus halophilus TaxID=51669 RepID=UPI0023E91468|nr:deoxyribose-phosphate aldolase [Tetragenococcus halophilus]GMA08744.1 deoxyribose-phosphate aldolase [Tetragenococcus halophilus subsp. flandriensis]
MTVDMTVEKLANKIDHTLLKADAQEADFEKLCQEAREYGFKMVAINSAPVALCKKLLQGSSVYVGAAIGFPLGQTTIETKAFETKEAIENGADEIDYVINISKLKDGDFSYIEKEMKAIVDICKNKGILSKVILETCYLTDEEKKKVCEIAKEIQPDFVKTSTGFGSAGATVADVQLMKQIVGNKVKVKAAGGIRDLKTAKEMIEAGAERLGMSAGVKVVEEYQNERG